MALPGTKFGSMEDVLDFLQTVYRFRLDTKLIPRVLEGPFYRAVERFQDSEELQKIDKSKMGICEEVADLTYQILKMVCLAEKILTEKTIRVLEDHLRANDHYDSDGKLAGLDYFRLDELSRNLVPRDLVKELRAMLPLSVFRPSGDDGTGIITDFLAGQYVAYISRIWRKHKAGGLQTIAYVRDEKIPEETRELIEALIKSSGDIKKEELFNDIQGSLYTANVLLIHVKRLRAVGEIRGLLNYLAEILKQKMNKPVTVEDTLQLMFLKMKGRQEMDFMGIDEITLRRTCKPVEYLIEADMFF